MINERMKQLAGLPALNENVGRTIVDQIIALDRRAMMAWGAFGRGRILTYSQAEQVPVGIAQMSSGYKGLDEASAAQVLKLVKPSKGGVILKVNGPKLKNGYIIINYVPGDFYDVIAGKVYSAKWKTVDEAERIYADMLVEVIDRIVG